MKVAVTLEARSLGFREGSKAEWLYVMTKTMRIERLVVQVVDLMDVTARTERTVALSRADVGAVESMMRDREQWISAELLEFHEVGLVVHERARVSIEVARVVSTREPSRVLVTLLGEAST